MSDLDSVHAEIRQCTRCRLSGGRTHAVPGAGPANARLMFVGEAPGFHEDQQALPFVGAAGRFLEELLATINLTREQVFITNVVKCRPPDNRDPQPDEIEACRGYLDRQIACIAPKVIVTLGRFSMQLAFTGVSITRVHGQPKRIGEILYMPMFHPAAALHQPRYRSLIEQDMLKIPGLLSTVSAPAAEEQRAAPHEQLSLF